MQIRDTENKWKEMSLAAHNHVETIIAPDDSLMENCDNPVLVGYAWSGDLVHSITTSLGGAIHCYCETVRVTWLNRQIIRSESFENQAFRQWKEEKKKYKPNQIK